VKISKLDPLTGKINTLTLDITQEQYDNWFYGMLIQKAMPHLSADDREFLITGLMPNSFDKLHNIEEP